MRRLFDADTWSEILHTLRINKRRTITTAGGVFWGLFLLVILLSFGEGIVNQQNRSLGIMASSGNMFVFYTGRTSQPYAGYAKGRTIYFNEKDIKALYSRFPQLDKIDYMLYVEEMPNREITSQGRRATIENFLAATPAYFEENVMSVVEGRSLNMQDEYHRRSCCLLGEFVASQLFPNGDAVGSTIKVMNTYLTIVGTVKPASDNFYVGTGFRSDVIIPLSLMQSLFVTDGNLTNLIITFNEEKTADPEKLFNNVKSYLGERKKISPDDENAIMGFDVSAFPRLSKMLIVGITLLVWIVGIGTLLAGVIGVSNILLVSIAERTREIGIKRAIGAQKGSIRTQILLEATTITSLSGILGVSLAILLMFLVDSGVGENSSFLYNVMIPWHLAILIILIVVLAGILAGILPAARALRIDPIKALQEE